MRVVFAVVALLALAACTSQQPSDVAPMPVPGSEDVDEAVVSDDANTVEITGNGFSPRVITVDAGETVTWVNNGAAARWPASNRHPVHTDYPADYSGDSYLSSQACSGPGEAKLGAFDACRQLGHGDSYSFTFNEVGSWSYHDHRNPSAGGVVIVE